VASPIDDITHSMEGTPKIKVPYRIKAVNAHSISSIHFKMSILYNLNGRITVYNSASSCFIHALQRHIRTKEHYNVTNPNHVITLSTTFGTIL
jgi:hypothetical protein